MGLKLKITLRSERKFVVLASRPILHWCDECGAKTQFVDEKTEAEAIGPLAASAANAHRLIIEGQSFLCLRSVSAQP